MLQLNECEPEVLRVRAAELRELGGKNILALQAFVSTHPSWFSKLVIKDRSIMDDAFKELEDVNAMLKERNN